VQYFQGMKLHCKSGIFPLVWLSTGHFDFHCVSGTASQCWGKRAGSKLDWKKEQLLHEGRVAVL